MKLNLSIVFLFCCLISLNANAEVKNNPTHLKNQNKELLKYQGDKYIASKNFAKKIDDSCKIAHPFGGTDKEIDNEIKKCILSKITFGYETTIDNMKLNEKVYLPSINGINVFLEKIKQMDTSNVDDENIVEVKIFTKINDQIKDSLTIYYLKNDYNGFYVETQYYYIDKFIYILKFGSYEDGSTIKFWKKYSIGNNGKFKLNESIECHHKFENGKEKKICQ